MERPLLFLDVDGVLNCTAFRGEGCDVIEKEGDFGNLVAWAPLGTKARLQKLVKRFEIVWATAWMAGAHSFFREAFELPEEPWRNLVYVDLKLPEIVKVAKDRPFAWLDDDVRFELREIERRCLHSQLLGVHPGRALFINVDPEVGLTDAHVTSLLAFHKLVTC